MASLTIATTTAINLLINTPNYYNKFRHIQNLLIRITLPYVFIVALVGFITNTATILLLSKSFFTKNSRHRWTLIALALSDLVHNSALSIRVIHDITSGKIEYLCIIISFLSHLAELLSACFTVLFTVQRYTAVRYPLKVVVQNRSSPIVIIFLIVFLSILFCIALSHKNTYADCHEELQLIWFIADALFSFIIPFSLILIFNIYIVNLIKTHARSSITKQSILLKPLKPIKNNIINHKDKKTNRHEEVHSIIYSCGNPRTTSERALSDPDTDIKTNSDSSSIKKNEDKKPKLSNKISNDHQPSEISSPISPIGKVSLDARSSTSSCHSIKSQNDHKKKCQSRRISHQSNDIDCVSTKDPQIIQSVRVTRMLVLVSTCFLILNAPAHLCVIAMKIYIGMESQVFNEHVELDNFKQSKNLTNNQLKNFVFIQTNNNKTIIKNEHIPSHDIDIVDDQILIHVLYIAVLLTQLISYISYSINFFLYSYSGITFRTSFRKFFIK